MKYGKIIKTGAVILSVLLAGMPAAVSAAGEETGSKVDQVLSGLSEETGLHLDCSMEQDGSDVSMNMYERGDDFYADVFTDGEEIILVADADYLAVLDPVTKTYDIMVIEGDVEAQLEDIKANFNSVLKVETGLARDYKEGTVELDGNAYVTEEYEADGQKVIFAFDEKDAMRAMIVDTGSGQTVLNIRELDGNIPEDQFLIPADYAYVGDMTDEDTGLETESEEEADISDYAVFSSEMMDFSFLYNKAHTARITDSGAAELAINGDDSLVGLFVSCVSDVNMPEVSQLLEEESFNVQQKYQNAMVDLPEIDSSTIEGHDLDGMVYAYSDTQGRTVDCAYFVEVRDGRYIFYETEALRENSGPELEALGEALVTLEPDASYYDDMGLEKLAESAAVTIPDEEYWDPEVEDVASQIESGFVFDTDPDYLILSDEDVTMVYTGGSMEGSYFAVERVDLPDTIGDAVVQRIQEVKDFLQERVATPPEVSTLEFGNRRLAGTEYAYSAVDGSKTIEGAEYYEEVDGEVYNWYCFYDRGDTETYDAMLYAMETFSVG